MSQKLPSQLQLPAELAVALLEVAAKTARATRHAMHRPRSTRRGQTLRPGGHTPLWNELAAAVRAQLTRYGDKAKLGRLLGLPRQRINDLLIARRYLPDAERTLLLLAWLHSRQQGLDPA